jgi:hypothetical protein
MTVSLLVRHRCRKVATSRLEDRFRNMPERPVGSSTSPPADQRGREEAGKDVTGARIAHDMAPRNAASASAFAQDCRLEAVNVNINRQMARGRGFSSAAV